MSEMLGNQYFMSRKYSEAKHIFEKCIAKGTSNNIIRKRLVICYTQTNEIYKALSLFHEILKDNIEIITDTHPIIDDCPCPELVYNLEKTVPGQEIELERNILLGILWLYCSIDNSIKYFSIAKSLSPSNTTIHSIHNIISGHIKSRISDQQSH